MPKAINLSKQLVINFSPIMQTNSPPQYTKLMQTNHVYVYEKLIFFWIDHRKRFCLFVLYRNNFQFFILALNVQVGRCLYKHHSFEYLYYLSPQKKSDS